MSITNSVGADAEAVVRDLIATAFSDPARVDEGFLRCVAEDYIQHNPDVPDGRSGAMGFFHELWRMFPEFTYEVQHLLTTGDMVAVHALGRGRPGDDGRVVVDLFRVADGLVVEHWDAVQDVRPPTAGSLPMIGDLHPARPDAPSGASAVHDLLDTAFRDPTRVREGFERCVRADFAQHSPDVADGRDGAIAFFESLWATVPEFRYEVRHLLHSGDLVLVHAFARTGEGPGAVIVDLFRVADGLVVEHWDCVQSIPETAANDHPMF